MLEKGKLAEAAKEAQRQRDLFSKVPRQSYTNLPRTQSARGLLSTMFHPPPEYFPVDHPYRRSMSTHDILAQGPRAFVPLNSGIAASKSAAAVPVAAAVTAAPMPSQAAPVCSPNKTRRSPLRLKGRQADADLEDDSGDEEDQNKLHVSMSVAEQKLAELQQKVTTRRASMHQQQQQPSGLAQQAQQQRQHARFNAPPESQRAGPSQYQQAPAPAAPVPITALFPYNLPAPQPPTTPRTTRRNFLAHELSESLRRNMLWERQISRQRPLRRTMTVANGIANANAVSNGMTNGGVGAGPSINRPPLSSAQSDGAALQQQQHQQHQVDPVTQRLDERRRAAIARTKSWGGEFHAAGW